MSSQNFSNIKFDLPKNQSNVIKVIGVGGGGSNAVNYMYSQGIKGVDFVVCNTDAQALQNSPITNKIQLGITLTEGLGAGANPEVGKRAAEESINEIKKMLEVNSKMVFITVGMGGGTGTGAAPVIARVARELDLLTIGIVTIPFSFEGKMRNDQAQKGIKELREYVDSLVVINNNKLREVYGNLGFKAGFSKADEVLSTASRGIAEVITHHYTQNIDLKDAKTVLSNSGTAIMGSAIASGENRSEEAISKALDSPLLNDNKITGAKNVLLLIVSGGEEITIDEIGEINDYIQSEAKSNVNIIMGVGEDDSLGESISVTIVATGFAQDQQHDISNTQPNKIIHTLDFESTTSFDFSDEKLEEKENQVSPQSNSEEENDEEKIVFDLKNDDEIELIPTTEFIKNIEVVYEEVDFNNDEDYVITDVTQKVEEPEIEVEDKNQTMLTFDFPLEKKEKIDDESVKKINELDVIDHTVVKPTKKVNEDVHFTLEDYTELENTLTSATNEKTQSIEDEGNENLNFTLRKEDKVPDSDNANEDIDKSNVAPLDMTLAELREKSDERRKKLKNFNYKFVNNLNSNIDDIENEPAYKRMGIDIDNDKKHSSDNDSSRTTLDTDKDDNVQLRSNNSFLHDNVD